MRAGSLLFSFGIAIAFKENTCESRRMIVSDPPYAAEARSAQKIENFDDLGFEEVRARPRGHGLRAPAKTFRLACSRLRIARARRRRFPRAPAARGLPRNRLPSCFGAPRRCPMAEKKKPQRHAWRAVPLGEYRFEPIVASSFRDVEDACVARLRAAPVCAAEIGAGWHERMPVSTRLSLVADGILLVRAEIDGAAPPGPPPVFAWLGAVEGAGLSISATRAPIRRVVFLAYSGRDRALEAAVADFAYDLLPRLGGEAPPDLERAQAIAARAFMRHGAKRPKAKKEPAA